MTTVTLEGLSYNHNTGERVIRVFLFPQIELFKAV